MSETKEAEGEGPRWSKVPEYTGEIIPLGRFDHVYKVAWDRKRYGDLYYVRRDEPCVLFVFGDGKYCATDVFLARRASANGWEKEAYSRAKARGLLPKTELEQAQEENKRLRVENERLRDHLKTITDCYGVGWKTSDAFVGAVHDFMMDARAALVDTGGTKEEE